MTAYFWNGSFNVNKYGPSWHRGELDYEAIEPGDTVTIGMKKALVYEQELQVVPIQYCVNDEWHDLDDKHMLVNFDPLTETVTPLRQVDWYTPIQNRQYADVLDVLTETYPLAGIVQCGPKGEVIAIQMEMEGFDVAGDENEKHVAFLLVSDNRVTGEKHFGVTIVRVVCNNTYIAATTNADDLRLPNGSDALDVLQYRTAVEQMVIEKRNNHINQLETMYNQELTEATIDKVFNELFPVDVKKSPRIKLKEKGDAVGLEDEERFEEFEKKARRSANLRQNRITRHLSYRKEVRDNLARFNQEFPNAANTHYAFWQAITEFYNHSLQFKSEQDIKATKLFFKDFAKAQNTAFEILSR